MIISFKYLGRKFKEYEKNINKYDYVWNICDNYKYYYNINCFLNMKDLNINILCYRFWGVKFVLIVDDVNNFYYFFYYIFYFDYYYYFFVNF